MFCATHASILTRVGRSSPFGLPCISDTTLSYHPFGSVASVVCLSPVEFSAQERLTSELLRTL